LQHEKSKLPVGPHGETKWPSKTLYILIKKFFD